MTTAAKRRWVDGVLGCGYSPDGRERSAEVDGSQQRDHEAASWRLFEGGRRIVSGLCDDLGTAKRKARAEAKRRGWETT